MLLGLFCLMVFVDFGVDVIKVELGLYGDMSCVWGLFDCGVSMYYLFCNCNKCGICVDFW